VATAAPATVLHLPALALAIRMENAVGQRHRYYCPTAQPPPPDPTIGRIPPLSPTEEPRSRKLVVQRITHVPPRRTGYRATTSTTITHPRFRLGLWAKLADRPRVNRVHFRLTHVPTIQIVG
jgi:hypothetical protein